MKFIQPEVFLPSFTCPHCSVIAQQDWWQRSFKNGVYHDRNSDEIRVGHCQHCKQYTLWVVEQIVYPNNGNAPSPNVEMPDSVRKIYLEASSIYQKSPRGAAALLRLGIQVLCRELGESGTNINSDIKNLVAKGLPTIVQRSLDIVRVTGNEAVHPGQIDTDDPLVVGSLFELLNIVVQYMISLPKQVGDLYSTLPVDKVTAIESRDSR